MSIAWRKPEIVRSYCDAEEFDEHYAVVEEIMKEIGKIPDPSDLTDRVRGIGTDLASLEMPCVVAAADSSSPEVRTLARDVLEQVEALRDRVATLIVDLNEARTTAKIATSGKGEVINARGRPSTA